VSKAHGVHFSRFVRCNNYIQLRYYIILSFLLFAFASCSSQEPDSRAVELNDIAVEKFFMNPDSALILLNQAIEIDPNFATAYSNKITKLNELGLNEQALITALEFSKTKNFPIKGNVVVGMAYERVGKFEEAKQYHSKALKYYEGDEWRTDPILSQLDYGILTTITRDKEIGMKVYMRILGEAKFSEEEQKLITMFMNEIRSYKGGGFIEFLDTKNTIEYCINDEDEETIEAELSNSGTNYVGKSTNSNNNEIRFQIKEKFKLQVEELGLQECNY